MDRKAVFIILISLITITLIYLNPSLDGHAVLVAKEMSLSKEIPLDLSMNEDQDYTLSMDVENFTYLKSLNISGSLILVEDGSANVYLLKDGERILILDKSAILADGVIQITNQIIETFNETTNETQTNVVIITEYIFEDLCVSTCSLTQEFNQSLYSILFEVQNVSLKINSIKYNAAYLGYEEKVEEEIEEVELLPPEVEYSEPEEVDGTGIWLKDIKITNPNNQSFFNLTINAQVPENATDIEISSEGILIQNMRTFILDLEPNQILILKVQYMLEVEIEEEVEEEEEEIEEIGNVSKKETEFAEQTVEGLYYEKTVELNGSGRVSVEIELPEVLEDIEVLEENIPRGFERSDKGVRLTLNLSKKTLKIKGIIPNDQIIKFDKEVYSHPPGVEFPIHFYVRNPLTKSQKMDLVLPSDPRLSILKVYKEGVSVGFSDYQIPPDKLEKIKYKHPENFRVISFSQNFEPKQKVSFTIIARMPEEKDRGKFYFDILGDFVFSVDPWWDNNWSYRKRITITNNNASETLRKNFTVNMTFNAQSMINDGKMLVNGSDARIVFENSSGANELDRLNMTKFNLTTTNLFFKLQANIAGGGSDNDYFLYYGNPSAGAPPTNTSKIFQKLEVDSYTAGLWHMDDGSGSSTTADSSGNGNTGTLTDMNTTGNATSGWAGSDGGLIDSTNYNLTGDSLRFDGLDDHVRVSGDQSLNMTPSGKMTYQMWVKPNSYPAPSTNIVETLRQDNGGYMMSYRGDLASPNWELGIFQTDNIAIYPAGITSSDIPIDTWTHVAMIANGTHVVAFINGTQKSSQTYDGTIRATSQFGGDMSVVIGAYESIGSFSRFFNGTIDEVAIYNRSLSAEEIKYHYWRRMYFTPEPTASIEEEVNQTCIYNSGTTTLTSNLYCYDLNITNGATLTTNNYNVSMDNNFNLINGTFNAGASYITVDGNWNTSSTDVTFNRGTSTVKFTGDGKSVYTYNNQDFYKLVLAGGSSITFNSGGPVIRNLTVGDTSPANMTINTPVYLMGLGTPLTIYSGSTFSGTTGFYWNGAGDQNIPGYNYNIRINIFTNAPPSLSTKTLLGNINVTTLTILDYAEPRGTILDTNNYNITATSLSIGSTTFDVNDSIMAGSSIINITGDVEIRNDNSSIYANSSTWYVGRNWNTTNGTFSRGTSTVNLTGTGNISTKDYTTNAFYNLKVGAAGQTTSHTTHIGTYGTLTVGTGTYSTAISSSHYLRNATTPLVNNGILNANIAYATGGPVNIVSTTYGGSLSIEVGNGVTATLAGNIIVNGGIFRVAQWTAGHIDTLNTNNFNIIGSSTTDFYLGYGAGKGDGILNSSSSTIQMRNVYISTENSYMNMGTSLFSLSGIWVSNSASSSWNAGTSNVTFNGITQSINVTNISYANFYNLFIKNSSNVTLDSNLNLSGSFGDGSDSGTLNMQSYTMYVGENWNSSSSSLSFNRGTSTVDLYGTGNINVRDDTTNAFYSLTVGVAGEVTTLRSSVGVYNLLTVGAGTLQWNGLYLRGTTTNPPLQNSGTITSTVTYAASNQLVAGTTYGGLVEVTPSPGGSISLNGDTNFSSLIIHALAAGTGILNTNGYSMKADWLTLGNPSVSTNYGALNASSSIVNVTRSVYIKWSDSYVNVTTGDWYVGGNWESNSTSSNWDMGTSKVIFNNGTQQNVTTMGTITPFYDIELQNSGTVLYLKNDIQMRSINVTNGTELRIDAVSEAKNLTLYFLDLSGAGFKSGGWSDYYGDLTTIGNWTYRVKIRSNATGIPSNLWVIPNGAGVTLNMSYTTFNYHKTVWMRSNQNDILNCTFSTTTVVGAVFFISQPARFENVTIGTAYIGVSTQTNIYNLNNVIILDSQYRDVSVTTPNSRLEFNNSNFDTSRVVFSASGTAAVISQNHNDVANDYKIWVEQSSSRLKSTITNDFGVNDNVEILNGTFVLDENATAQTILIDSDATLQIGEDTPTQSIWLEFADVADAGFSNNSAGNLTTKGTASYQMYVTSVNEPPTNYWSLKTVRMDMAMDFTTLSYYDMKWIWHWGGRTVDVENCVFNYGKSNGFYHTGTAWTAFNNNTLSNSVDSGLYVDYSSVDLFIADNITITNSGIYDIRIKNKPHIEFNNSNFNISSIWYNPASTNHGASIISDNHNDLSNSYKIWVEFGQNLSKSNITNDFTSSSNVELLNGTLIIDEPAESNNFTINSPAILNITSTFSVTDILNQTGNLNIYNNQDVAVRNMYVNESALLVASDSSLYVLNVDGSGEARVWSNFHHKTNTIGLVGWWRLNEESGSTTADDSGNGNTGTLYNMNTTLDGNLSSGRVSSGKFKNAIRFDGEDDYVLISNINLPSPSQLTIGLWADSSFSATQFQTIVGDAAQSVSSGFIWMFRWENSNRLTYQYANGSAYKSINYENFFTDDNTHHIAIVADYNNKTFTLYKDGQLFEQKTITDTPIPPDSTDLYIGKYSSGMHPFNGTIDEVKIYNRSLSSSEILESYIKGLQNHNITATGNITVDSNTEVAYDNVTANLTNVKTLGNMTIRGAETVLTTINITSGSEFKLDSVNADQNTTLKFNDVSGAGFTSDSAGTLTALGNETYRVTITSVNQPPTNYWSGETSSGGMSITADYATFSYMTWITIIGTADIDHTTFQTTSGGFWAVRMYTATTISSFTHNTFNSVAYGMDVYQNYTAFDNIVFTSTTWDIGAHNARIEFTDSNFGTSNIDLYTSGNIISKTHNDIANAYKIMATTLSKSTITNDFGLNDNVELISGTLTIDESAESNNFTIDSGSTLNITSTFSVTDTLNQTGNLNIYNDQDIIVKDMYVDESKLSVASDSSLYVLNVNDTEKARVWGDFHHKTNTTGLVGWWRLNEGSGNTFNDSSDNNLDGSLTSTNVTWTVGKFDDALKFNRTNGAAEVSSSSLFTVNEHTLEAWINLAGFPGFKIIERRDSGYEIAISGEYLRGYVYNNSGWQFVQYNTPLLTDKWYHLAQTWDNFTLKLFVNGEEVASENIIGPITGGSGPIRIGASDTGTTNQFNGTIDEVKIYNRSLSSAEILESYIKGLQNHNITATSSANITVDSNTEVAYDNVTANLTNVKTIGNMTIRGAETVLTTLNITSGSEFKLDSVNANQNTTLKFNDVSGAGFTSDSAGTLTAFGSENYRVTITTTDPSPPPTNKWTWAVAGLDITADYTTFSHFYYHLNSVQSAIMDIDHSNFERDGSWGYFRISVTLTSFTYNTFTGAMLRFAENKPGFYASGVIDNCAFEEIIVDWNSKVETTDSTVSGTVTIDDNANDDRYIIFDTYGGTANDYRIYAHATTKTSKSSITNDFTINDNVELISGTLTIDEEAESNNFTINSTATLNVSANNLTVYNTLNQSGNLVVTNDGNVISANSLIDASKLTVDSDSSLYAKNYDLNTSETRVYGDFHYTNETPQLPEEIDNDDYDLIGLWHMNEGSGDNVADSSGNGNDGTRYNMEGSDWVSGKFSYGLEFDGVDEYISIADSILWDFAGKNVTLSVWFKANPVQTDQWPRFFDHFTGGSPGAGWLFGLDIEGDHLMFEARDDGTGNDINLKSTNTYNDSTWHHAAVTLNGTTAILYVNGFLDDTDEYNNLNDRDQLLYIGADTVNYNFNGTLDEFAIFNRTLSATEIKQHYGIGLEKHRTIKLNESGGLSADGTSMRFRNVTIINPSSTNWDLYLDNSNATASNFTFGGILTSFEARDVGMRNVSNPPSTPGFYNLGEFLNLTSTSGSSWMNLNISYSGSPSGENSYKMYKYVSGSGWVAESNTGVDTTRKVVWANITSFSMFAPLSGTPSGPNGPTGPTTPGPAPGIGPTPGERFEVDPSSIEVDLDLWRSMDKPLTVINTGTRNLSIVMDKGELGNWVTLPPSFSLNINESKTIKFVFYGSELGVKTGTIEIRSERFVKEIPVVIEVETEITLFDAKVDIPPEFEEVDAGEDLKAQVSLFRIGSAETMVDVIITYLIKDLEDNVISIESETFAVLDQISYTKAFRVPSTLSSGTYVVAIEVVYENSFATSSAMFDVKGVEVMPLGIMDMVGMIILIASIAGLTAYFAFLRKRTPVSSPSEESL